MRIYGYKIYQDMTAKRDKLRESYALQETKLATKYNPLVLKAKKRAKNFIHFWLYSIVLLIIVFLTLHKKLSLPEVIATLSLVGLGVIALLVLAILFRYKREAIINEFNETSAKNQLIKEEVYKLNYELAKLAIAVITYSEHHDELNLISDEKELERRFKELYYLYHDAINSIYNNKATIEDYIDYYYKWENDLL